MLSALLTVMTCAAMSAAPGAGDTAPPISIEHALQTPEGATLDWEAFGDDPILLEFWGTWCGPCVAAIPHLNDLAAELRDDGLRVLAVTFEEPEKIEPFLKLRSIDGWVLCDTDRSMVEDFGVVSWPQTFLIQNGKILARTSPSALDAGVLRDVFAGRFDGDALSLEGRGGARITSGVDPFADDELADPDFKLIIRKGVSPAGSIAASPGGATMMSASVSSIVSWAWGVESLYVDVDNAVSEQTYDLIAVIPNGKRAEYLHAIQAIVATTLGVRVVNEVQSVTGFELRVGDGGLSLPDAPALAGGYSMQTWPDGSVSIAGTTMTIEQLVSMLPGILGAPVRSDIAGDAHYFVELKFEGREPAQVIKAFREQAGIEVVPYETTTTFAVVTLSDSPEQD